MLSLLPEPLTQHIVPNYFQSVRDMKVETAFKLMSLGPRLDLLMSCKKFEQVRGYPSWVPHLCSNCGGDVDNSVWSYASGNSEMSVVGVQESRLSVMGVYHSVVEFVGEEIQQDPLSLFDAVRDLKTSRVGGAWYRLGETFQEALAWVLSSYAVRDRWPKVQSYSTLEEWRAALIEPLESLTKEEAGQWVEAWLAKSVYSLVGRRFVRADSGRIGYVGRHVKPGK